MLLVYHDRSSARLVGMWLPWKWGLAVAASAFVFSLIAHSLLHRQFFSLARTRQLGVIKAILREIGVVMVLYSLWQVAGTWSVMGVSRAIDRARFVVRVERFLPIPSEVAVQKLLLPYPWVVKAANWYYAVAHVPALVGTLFWGFLVHRSQYSSLRNSVALTTAGCLLVQLIPLAPPRMLPDLGFVDTAELYNQSVYSVLGRGMAGQLAAMPSVHVAWAVVVMWFAIVVPARLLTKVVCVLHGLVTLVVVVGTANHFWLDGIVAGWIFGLSLLAITLAQRVLPTAQIAWVSTAIRRLQ